MEILFAILFFINMISVIVIVHSIIKIIILFSGGIYEIKICWAKKNIENYTKFVIEEMGKIK